jgi:hypothetical protein
MQNNDTVKAITRMQTSTAMPTAIPTPFDEPDACWLIGEPSCVDVGVDETGRVVGRGVDIKEDGVGVEESVRICGGIIVVFGERFCLEYWDSCVGFGVVYVLCERC